MQEVERKVIISGEVFLYQQKAPFIESGHSLYGALEWDEVNDKVRCHECGEWHEHVGQHAVRDHDMLSREYKLKHGLNISSALISEGLRVRMIDGQTGANEKLGVPEQDDSGELLCCQECGSWCSNLGRHVWQEHKIKSAEYKRKYGLAMSCSLVSAGLRTSLRAEQNGFRSVNKSLNTAEVGKARLSASEADAGRGVRSELRNKRGRCPAQLLERLRQLHLKLGRTPSAKEMNAFGLDNNSIRYLFGKSRGEFLLDLGMEPRANSRRRYSRIVLAEMMRDFYVRHQRVPTGSDFRRGLLPSVAAYYKAFGGMSNAYFAAGLELVVQRQRIENRFKYSVAGLKQTLRDFVQKHGRWPHVGEFGTEALKPSDKTFRRYFRLGDVHQEIMQEVAQNLSNSEQLLQPVM